MPLVNLARDILADKLIGGVTYNAFSNANAHLGVGDSTDAFDAADTDLQAATNKDRQPMEATYPSRAANVLTARAIWGTAEGNFAWEEWGFFNASSAAQMLSRKVEALGTKTSAASWQLTVTLTFALA